MLLPTQAHKKTCAEKPCEIREAVSEPVTQKQPTRNLSLVQMFKEVDRSQEDADYLLAMAMITSDIPYRFLQNPFLIAYQEKYESKGRQRLSDFRMRTKVLPRLYLEHKKQQVDCIEKHNNWTLCLDGWEDSSHNSIVAVMLIDHSSHHYIGNLELDGVLHSAENIEATLKELLGDNIDRVKGIVTDSPNVNVKFRQSFCANNTHVLNLRCVLHVLNLIIKDLLQDPFVKPIAKDVSKLVTFFSNSHYW